ncbi:m7GpppN-mRNA hydrolase-like [Thalassophryne amazonica]|uniref:m7GpppN-mRNA hydrolase-like n=1 Tax=Thalassophryne amazonica TaxID=390379 RepID=UPI0014724EE4|nr:m7GpppN-mRNA hydrolase-like [Thalassophryne amazonica]
MGRKLRTTLPILQDSLNPRWPDFEKIHQANASAKQKQAQFYNRRNGVQWLSPLSPEDPVLTKLDGRKQWTMPAVVQSASSTPRSYIVETTQVKTQTFTYYLFSTNTGQENVKLTAHLEELHSKFIQDSEDKDDLNQLCFNMEKAHWHYLDVYMPQCPRLPKLSLEQFVHLFFNHFPYLLPNGENVHSVLRKWYEYRKTIPIYGAIILDKTMRDVLLVQTFHGRWSFPSGKLDKGEKQIDCGIREVEEETGFDIKNKICQHNYIEVKIANRVTGLYIIVGVSKDTIFQPKTVNEIQDIQWFSIDKLSQKHQFERGHNKFYTVTKFIRPLQRWIDTHQSLSQGRLTASSSWRPSPSGFDTWAARRLQEYETRTADGWSKRKD